MDFDSLEYWKRGKTPRAEHILGTDQYIAPEAYAGKYSPSTDIFAVGVMLYKIMTNKFPFRNDLFDDQPGENYVKHPKMAEIRNKLKAACPAIDFQNYPIFLEHPYAADFIRKMLVADESRRINMRTLIRHPFLVEYQFLVEEPHLTAKLYPSLGTFGTLQPFFPSFPFSFHHPSGQQFGQLQQFTTSSQQQNHQQQLVLPVLSPTSSSSSSAAFGPVVSAVSSSTSANINRNSYNNNQNLNSSTNNSATNNFNINNITSSSSSSSQQSFSGSRGPVQVHTGGYIPPPTSSTNSNNAAINGNFPYPLDAHLHSFTNHSSQQHQQNVPPTKLFNLASYRPDGGVVSAAILQNLEQQYEYFHSRNGSDDVALQNAFKRFGANDLADTMQQYYCYQQQQQQQFSSSSSGFNSIIGPTTNCQNQNSNTIRTDSDNDSDNDIYRTQYEFTTSNINNQNHQYNQNNGGGSQPQQASFLPNLPNIINSRELHGHSSGLPNICQQPTTNRVSCIKQSGLAKLLLYGNSYKPSLLYDRERARVVCCSELLLKKFGYENQEELILNWGCDARLAWLRIFSLYNNHIFSNDIHNNCCTENYTTSCSDQQQHNQLNNTNNCCSPPQTAEISIDLEPHLLDIFKKIEKEYENQLVELEKLEKLEKSTTTTAEKYNNCSAVMSTFMSGAHANGIFLDQKHFLDMLLLENDDNNFNRNNEMNIDDSGGGGMCSTRMGDNTQVEGNLSEVYTLGQEWNLWNTVQKEQIFDLLGRGRGSTTTSTTTLRGGGGLSLGGGGNGGDGGENRQEEQEVEEEEGRRDPESGWVLQRNPPVAILTFLRLLSMPTSTSSTTSSSTTARTRASTDYCTNHKDKATTDYNNRFGFQQLQQKNSPAPMSTINSNSNNSNTNNNSTSLHNQQQQSCANRSSFNTLLTTPMTTTSEQENNKFKHLAASASILAPTTYNPAGLLREERPVSVSPRPSVSPKTGLLDLGKRRSSDSNYSTNYQSCAGDDSYSSAASFLLGQQQGQHGAGRGRGRDEADEAGENGNTNEGGCGKNTNSNSSNNNSTHFFSEWEREKLFEMYRAHFYLALNSATVKNHHAEQHAEEEAGRERMNNINQKDPDAEGYGGVFETRNENNKGNSPASPGRDGLIQSSRSGASCGSSATASSFQTSHSGSSLGFVKEALHTMGSLFFTHNNKAKSGTTSSKNIEGSHSQQHEHSNNSPSPSASRRSSGGAQSPNNRNDNSNSNPNDNHSHSNSPSPTNNRSNSASCSASGNSSLCTSPTTTRSCSPSTSPTRASSTLDNRRPELLSENINKSGSWSDAEGMPTRRKENSSTLYNFADHFVNLLHELNLLERQGAQQQQQHEEEEREQHPLLKAKTIGNHNVPNAKIKITNQQLLQQQFLPHRLPHQNHQRSVSDPPLFPTQGAAGQQKSSGSQHLNQNNAPQLQQQNYNTRNPGVYSPSRLSSTSKESTSAITNAQQTTTGWIGSNYLRHLMTAGLLSLDLDDASESGQEGGRKEYYQESYGTGTITASRSNQQQRQQSQQSSLTGEKMNREENNKSNFQFGPFFKRGGPRDADISGLAISTTPNDATRTTPEFPPTGQQPVLSYNSAFLAEAFRSSSSSSSSEQQQDDPDLLEPSSGAKPSSCNDLKLRKFSESDCSSTGTGAC